MKRKIFNLLLILFSMIGYLEWGKANHEFLFQSEAEILNKLFADPKSVLHPLILLPLAGQLLLLITLFQKQPSKVLTLVGLSSLSLLLLLIFIIGLMSFNWKMLLSAVPFILVAILTIRDIWLHRLHKV